MHNQKSLGLILTILIYYLRMQMELIRMMKQDLLILAYV